MATNVTELVNNNSDLKALSQAEIARKVGELTGGVDTSKINLKVKRGKYFAVFFSADGQPFYTTDPDDSSKVLLKITGDSSWYFVDELHNQLSNNEGASKFMAWIWSDSDKQYMKSLTREVNGKHVDVETGQVMSAEGVISHYIRRKAGSVRTVSVIAGVNELEALKNRAVEIMKALKGSKAADGKPAIPGKYPEDATDRLVEMLVLVVKSQNVTPAKFKSALVSHWKELFTPASK